MSNLPVKSPRPHRAVPMRSRFWRGFRGLWSWLFANVRFPEVAVKDLRELASRGTIVYVGRTRGWIFGLLLNWMALRFGLPLAMHVDGWRGRLAGSLGKSPAASKVGQPTPSPLLDVVCRGESALCFLWKRSAGLRLKQPALDVREVSALLELQAEQERPIFLVPVTLLLGFDPGTQLGRTPILDALFGPREMPGAIRAFLTFLRYRKRARLQLGEAVDLAALLARSTEVPADKLARMVRGSLVQHLARAERSVTGPVRKAPRRLRMEILRDHQLRASLAEAAREEGKPLSEIERRADRYLKEIAARYTPFVVAAMASFFRIVFNRIYDGIWVDEEGLQRMTDAGRRGPIVLCPSHRSHIDYLVMSWAMHMRGLTAPHIAAGKNLSFFPIGPILRRAGAFFLRRTFRGNPVYAATFRAYIRRLLHDGHPVEFFIEGTRSRSGKPLPARMGLATYEVEAFLEGSRSTLSFIPISIGYTRVIEARAYGKELRGEEKQSEDVSGLLGARKVLRKRWGRIYIQVGEPIELGAFLRERGIDREAVDEDTRRDLVVELANTLNHRIGALTTVTPTAPIAAALLGERRRGLDLSTIVERATLLVDFVAKEGDARVSDAVRYDDEGRLEEPTVRETVATLQDEGLVRTHQLGDRTIVELHPEGRLGLDYYKNALIPFLAGRALAATALVDARRLREGLAGGGEDPVRGAALALAETLAPEFVFDPASGAEGALDAAFEELVQDGRARLAVGATADAVFLEPTPEGWPVLLLLRAMTLALVEGYWITLTTASRLLSEAPLPRAELRQAILEEGRARTLIGEIDAPEALNRPLVEGAIDMLVQRGALVRGPGREALLELGDPLALTALIATLAPHVGTREAPGAGESSSAARTGD
ncbi:MAG: 1-acyl-sn-glycerol-3-phosphate acyltransferase [Deltaproteobacteria bacterium]|nr:1-acyl-sn-glycerol-3-phosphate acyltransferase [Deltaproteobacteria bacterium]